MIFEALNGNHVESAAKLALSEYYEERGIVPALPDGDYFERLCNLISEMTEHKLGVAAIENGETVGFLTCYKPWDNHFGRTMGTFSPIHAHGAVKSDRRRIYSLLYQKAAEKWVGQSILSHAISLYAHDTDAVESYFWNGFGLRCIDAIREVKPIECSDFSRLTFRELPKTEAARIAPMKNQLIGHLRSTPAFIPLRPDFDAAKLTAENERRNSRYFVAEEGGEILAFLEIMADGENFACDDPGMMNICGAYMLPEYRSSGVFTKLVSILMDVLASEGYSRCGVDFESFNPTATGFWMKHFTAYTHSVVRRIDERIRDR